MRPEPLLIVALNRAAIYRLLAASFTYPTPQHLESVAATALEAAAEAPVTLTGLLLRLADAARAADVPTLAGEHVLLFQRQVRCPPYEGAYGPPQLAGKAAILADVAGFYRAFALEPSEGQPEVEDHMCAELEFMSALALKEAWALAESHAEGLDVTRGAEREFLTDHLGRWGTAFADRVAAAAAPGFYPTAAALLRAWLAGEYAQMEITPVPLEGMIEAEAGAFTCPMAPASADEA